MRLPVLLLLGLAAAGCATREDMRAVQTPAIAPSAKLLAPENHELRDAIVVEWIGGVSQSSYFLAEPNQEVLRPYIQRALAETGLRAGTSTRARYGLRVLVLEALGPGPDADFNASVKAKYTLVERSSGRVVFETTVDSQGLAKFLPFNEGDLRTSMRRSASLLKVINPTAAAYALVDAGYAWDVTDWAGGHVDDLEAYDGYDQWTQGQWNEFWEVYRYSVLGALVAGPAITAAEVLNPANFIPNASPSAIAKAARDDGAATERNGALRAAQANQRAVAANVTAFLLELSDAKGMPLVPILPCFGDPAIETAKRTFLAQGVDFATDDCSVPR